VYVSDDLDGWAAKLARQDLVALVELLPEEYRLPAQTLSAHNHDHGHDHGEADPHFWMDPLAAKAALPALAETLCRWDPENCDGYDARSEAFERELAELDTELNAILAPVQGKSVIALHSSLVYMLTRYGIEAAGVIQASGGKEPSPGHMRELINRTKEADVAAILVESELPGDVPAMLSAETGVPLVRVNPLGAGVDSYAELLRSNARALAEALQ